MMKQFLDVKSKYKDCIVLFRAGDFYETFYEDAKIVSKVLNITLTQRAGVPMAGVPYHSISPYIKKLIDNNYKVAICEQLEDPKKAKGIVKRGVTRIITPGTVLEEDFISNSENIYILGVYLPKNISEKIGISVVDISTGEFLVSELINFNDLRSVVKKFNPKEVVLNENSYLKKKFIAFLKRQSIFFNFLSDLRYNKVFCEEIIKKQFENLDISSEFVRLSIGATLFYIYKLNKFGLTHIKEVKKVNFSEYMILDEITLRNLEIIESLFKKGKEGTLFGVLNSTKTPMGARLLKKHLIMPLLNIDIINKRLDGVEELLEKEIMREEIRDLLEEISDIERITSRIASGIATPKDLISLKISLIRCNDLKNVLGSLSSDIFKNLFIRDFGDVVNLIEKSIVDDAPSHRRDIGYIKRGFNEELDNLYEIAFNSKRVIKEIEENERIKTGINSLKIKFNKVFGYYIEVPKTYSDKVPNYYERKQTLVNAERFTTKELKEKEELIINSEEKIRNLEDAIYENIIRFLKGYVKDFQKVSETIALLDVLSSHAFNADVYGYCKPSFSHKFILKDSRNPIVERFVDDFVPNDCEFNEGDIVKIITGPNMSGKSTFLRQIGLICIMAQIGSFVPASFAELCIVDRIFTRIGAHDELSEGLSTFMVEMKETANILNNITSNSLVLLDEIGRGTSTYDGLAIAWAVVEFLISKKVKTIFATHYHYLNELEEYYNYVKNYHTLVREEGEKVEFLRKIVRGGTDKSYGIYVAKLAGLPDHVIKRAMEIQKSIESKNEIRISKESLKMKRKDKEYNSRKLDEFFK